MTHVQPWVREMTESVMGGPPCAVGEYRLIDGQPCRIVSGQYWGQFGLSNHWSWKVVLPNGSLSKEEKSGYGDSNWKKLSRRQAIRLAQKR